jgi:insulin-like growth factor 2 receptor
VCGKTLGYPNVVNSLPKNVGGGDAEIEWVTSAACKTLSKDAPKKENKCYALEWQFDKVDGFKEEIYDLNPLIRDVGYQVDNRAYKDVDMVVSPCRAVQSCNSVACRNVNGTYKPIANFSVEPRLNFTNNQLQIHYPLTNDLLAKCTDAHDKGFTFYFNCPVGDIETVPLLSFADTTNHCLHTIAWNTDHACGLKKISSPGCALQVGERTFNLTTDPSIMQRQSVVGNGATFLFDICSPKGLSNDDCAEHTGVRVAQHPSGGDNCYSAGGMFPALRYADDELVLSIPGGDSCSGGYHRRTIITFVCDKDVRNQTTNITYTGEEHCLYSFRWVTSAACLEDDSSSASKCRYKHGDHEYDFDELLQEDKNWVVAFPEEKGVCIQVSPCGNLVTKKLSGSAEYCKTGYAPPECANTSICNVTKDKGQPFGQFIPGENSHIVSSQGSVLTMRTLNGPPSCNNHSEYATIVDFVCRPGRLDSTPQFVGIDDGCEMKIEWQTAYACLDVITSGDGCHVEDPKTKISFDLNPLKSDTFYTFNTTDGKYTYEMNFCGSAIGTPCSTGSKDIIGMCQVINHDSAGKLAGVANSTVRYDGGVLQSVYVGGEKCTHGNVQRTTTVNFECDPDAHVPNVVEVDETSHCQYLATVQSVHACPADFKSMVCTHQHGDRTYDLSPLVKVGNDNWEAAHDNDFYIINVCRPLNLPRGGCTTSSAACKYSTKGGSTSFVSDLGKAKTGQFTVNGGKLILGYKTEDALHKINITFICDKSVKVTNGPTFEFELNNAYHFTWRTPYVCENTTESTEQTVELDKSCVIQDPLTRDVYNFSALHRSSDVKIRDTKGKATYYINVCAPLVNSTCGDHSTTVCQTLDTGGKFSAGVNGGQLTRHEDGSAVLVYDGGAVCSQNHKNRRSEILFVCPKDKSTFDQSTYVPAFVNESSHCVYNFHWETRLACIPKRIQCSVGNRFNLKPLAEENIPVSMSTVVGFETAKLVISLCGPVNISSDPNLRNCPFGTAACLTFRNNTAISLGEVEGDFNVLPNVTDGVQLLYTGGSACSGGKPSRVLIMLICAEEGAESTPELSTPDLTDCRFHIRWRTRYACSISSAQEGCKTRDPVSGAIFNIGEMIGKTTFNNIVSDVHSFHINVCGKDSITCGDGKNHVAGCQTKKSDSTSPTVMGLTSSNRVYNQDWGDWSVVFRDGDKCEDGKNKRSTYVHVICNKEFEGKKSKLEYLNDDRCEYYFRLSMYNSTVCHGIQPAEVCSLDGYNLLPLASLGNILAVGIWDPREKLYFSICQPLNLSVTLTGCQAHSLACLHTSNPSSSVSYSTSVALQVVDGGLNFVYSQSDKSDSRVTIHIHCRLSEEFGSAIVTDIKADSYNISLTSVYGCPLNISGLKSNSSKDICSITNPINELVYNFSKLLDSTHEQLSAADGSTYHFDLCGGIPSACSKSKSSVCKVPAGGDPIPIARKQHYLWIARDGAVEVVFEDRLPCASGGNYTSVTVTMVCSEKGGSPRLVSDPGECVVEILWPTPLLCEKAKECTAESETLYFDLTPLSATPVWTGTEEKGSGKVWFGVCRNLNPFESESHGCGASTGVCFEKSHKNSFSLGQLQDQPRIVNGHAVLQYTHGDVCSGSKRYSTTINLLCSKEEVEPRIQLGADNCSYVIDVSSPDACALEGKSQKIQANATYCVFKLSNYAEMDFGRFLHNPYTEPIKIGNFTVSVCNKATYKGAEYSFNATQSKAWRDTAVMVFSAGREDANCEGGHSVQVHFECDPKDSSDKGETSYHGSSSDGCTHVLYWTTRFACSSIRSKCTFQDSNNIIYDLSPLYHNSAYEVVSNGAKYYINICGSVNSTNPVYRDYCASDSSVCVPGSGGKYIDVASASSQKLAFSADGKLLLLTYEVRSPSCDGKGRVQTQLECNAIHQKPIFKSKSSDGCNYNFLMKTPYACKVATTTASCTCSDNVCPSGEAKNGYIFKMKDITKRLYPFKYSDGSSAMLRICAGCNNGNGAVCLQRDNSTVFSLTSTEFVVQDKLLSVTMKSDHGKKSVVVVLECWLSFFGLPSAELEFLHGPSKPDEDGVIHLQGFTSACEHTKATDGTTSSSTTLAPPPAPSTDPNKVGIAVVAILIVAAIILGGCMFILLKEKRRRYMLKGACMRIFTDKSNEPVKYTRLRKAEENEDDDEALLLGEDSERDVEVDTEGSKQERGALKTNAEKTDEEIDSGSDEELLDL